MKFLIKKTPDNFIQSVNDEISSILNRNFDSFFPEYVYNDDMYKCAMPVEIDEKDKEYLHLLREKYNLPVWFRWYSFVDKKLYEGV